MTAGEDTHWYDLTPGEAATRLGVDRTSGLAAAEAATRLVDHGPNRLPRSRRRSPLQAFVDQFRSSLIAVLMVAAVLAGLLGQTKDVVVISVVVVFNAVLGFVQEHRAESSLAALERMLVSTAQVRRDGEVALVDAEDLVPGDVVLVEAGARVPADGRWLSAFDLEVDESAFTGESIPVAKSEAAMPAATLPLAERHGMGFMNTTVTRGRGEFLVTGTGKATEIGRLASMLEAAEAPPTPLQREIAHLGRRLTLVAAGAVSLVVVLEVLRGVPAEDMLLNAVALAVAAIPEGLPAVLTVTLAVGTSQLARRRAIVKRLASVETLGATTVICSDKTGTLTVNQMTARRVHTAGRSFSVSGEGYGSDGSVSADDGGPPVSAGELDGMAAVCALCTDASVNEGRPIGDPTEAALVVLAAKCGVDVAGERERRPRIGEVPFESSAKYMATFHDAGEGIDVLVKGAPDVLLGRCTSRRVGPDGTEELDAAGRDALQAANADLAGVGFRVIATASRRIEDTVWDPHADPRAHVENLRFEGLVGLADPPRPEARRAIERCRRAGIDVKMITGDHAVTAGTIAAELGIGGEVVTGPDLDRLGVAELASGIRDIGVFARVAPEHKVAIVEALQERGHVVAMTGDGVNDAPALKRADIGVAMGINGTEVSKEAASMVLADDNFATIVNAVEGGRTIYDNIIKFVTFQLSTNIGAILTIVVASLLNWPADGRVFFAPLAILWVNIIMDGPAAMALGVDPAGPGTMTRPPRSPDSQILTVRRLARIATYGAIMTAGTLVAYRVTVGPAPMSDTDAARGAVVALTAFVFFQLFNLHNARFPDHPALRRHLFRNWRLWAASGSVLVVQVAMISVSRAQQLITGRDVAVVLRPRDWLLAVAVAAPILALEELRKSVTAPRRVTAVEPAAPISPLRSPPPPRAPAGR